MLGTREVYDEPVGSGVRDPYVRLLEGDWGDPAPWPAEALDATGLFDQAVERTASGRDTLPPDTVIGLEHTRATMLHFDDDTRAAFGAGLRELLAGRSEVLLERRTSLTMARVRRSSGVRRGGRPARPPCRRATR